MARQKEHLVAQQQALAKQQMGIGSHAILPHQLQHHSSAHSLQSQPSFGSITSPGGYQPSPSQGPLPGGPAVPGLLDNAFRPTSVPGLGPVGPGIDAIGNIRNEQDVSLMMDRMNLNRAGQPSFTGAPPQFGGQQPSDSNAHAQQVVQMLNDRARLQREQEQHDALQRSGQEDQQAAQASADRLQQFQDLRVQTDLGQHNTNVGSGEAMASKPSASTADPSTAQSEHEQSQPQEGRAQAAQAEEQRTEPLSLTEQVQKAASAKQTPQPQSAWNKVEPAIHPFPPPPSQSPLPAPAAQRKPIVADSLAGESRSRSETPSADTPSASIAPWAKEPSEAPRGPSLREIQEAEARKAAEREALAAAARREAYEKELAAQAQVSAPQPGLPSSSTWASGASASPVTPAAGNASVWQKPAAGKPQGQPTPAAKKTLQQIQKEEEARKQRAATQAQAQAQAATASNFGPPTPSAGAGKRYADLASKQTASPPVTGGGAWTTVGSSGKAKAPIAAPVPPPTVRSTSIGVVPVVAKKPPVVRSITSQVSGQVNAQEEFKKWALGELRGDLNRSINGKHLKVLGF